MEYLTVSETDMGDTVVYLTRPGTIIVYLTEILD